MDNNNIMNTADFDGLHEECGVFGAYDFDGEDVASTIYYGLFALQHLSLIHISEPTRLLSI